MYNEWSLSVNEKPRDVSPAVTVLQVKKIGNSLGVILPKELLARLKLQVGDTLHVVETTERGMKLSPYDPKHGKAMEIARKAFRKYADTFKALAK
jgi:putative addiction module antidote